MQSRRSSCSCSCSYRALLLSLVWLTSVAAAQNTTVSVATDLEFQRALKDPQVSRVVLVDDIQLQEQTWQREDRSRPAFVSNRSITITSRPPYRAIDFAFLATNWLKMASGTRLNISNTILKQSRYGVGMALDFLAPSPGALLVVWNAAVVRHLCVDTVDEPEAIASVPRIPEFPGTQRAHWADYCFRDTCFERVIVYDDFTKLSAVTADTAAGGYALAMFNVSKVCRGFVDKCRDSSIAEACMQRAIDALPHAAPTPGRLAMAQEAAEVAAGQQRQQRQQHATLGAAIGAGAGFCLLLALLAAVLVRHRRKLQQAIGKDHTILPLAKPPVPFNGLAGHADKDAPPRATDQGSLPALYQAKDVQVTEEQDPSVALSSSSSRPVSQLGSSPVPRTEQLGPPSAQDTWELAAWKTSAHSLRRLTALQQQQQPQQQHSADDLAIRIDSGPLYGPLSISPHPGQTKVLTSHQLILQGTGASTSQQMMTTNKISLGVVIGAGSFGKVYKGKWRGIDVAVKVVQHSQAAAATVANEIDLMMGLQHPHLVSAYHFVTWRRRKDSLPHYSGDQVPSEVQQASVSSESLTCGITSNSLPGAAPGGEMSDEDMQTYIVQEYCDAGNLGDYSIIHGDKQEGELPAGHAMLRLLFRLREVAEGMQFLHDTARVVHGDLKSNNILLCVAPTAPYGRTAKVADFGLARVYQAGETHKSTKTLGTVNHMAPELLRYGKASTSADVYSFGIMCWELLTGQVAFKGWQWGAILEHVALGNGRPLVPEGAPEDFVLLLESCWHRDPAKRPTFVEVLTCINIMITSRQQELMEQAAGVSTCTHSATAAIAVTGAVLHMDKDAYVSHNSTGPMAVDPGAAENSTSSNGEWDIVRVGSMRHLSGASNATNRSSPAAARISSKHLRRSSHPGQLPLTPQQQGWHPTGTSASWATSVLTEQGETGDNGCSEQGQLSCPGPASRSDTLYGPQDLE